jgi:hypothetical protein
VPSAILGSQKSTMLALHCCRYPVNAKICYAGLAEQIERAYRDRGRNIQPSEVGRPAMNAEGLVSALETPQSEAGIQHGAKKLERQITRTAQRVQVIASSALALEKPAKRLLGPKRQVAGGHAHQERSLWVMNDENQSKPRSICFDWIASKPLPGRPNRV